MRMRFVLCYGLLCLGLMTSSQASAGVIQGGSAGTGDNRSTLVIDFGPFAGGDTVVFDYFHNDVDNASNEDMLLDLEAATSLVVDSSFFSGLGLFVNGFTFGTNSSIPTFGGANGETWEFLVFDTVQNEYVPSGEGVSATLLEDGSITGFILNTPSFNASETNPQTFNRPTVVPEPTSAALLALTGAALLRRRRA